MSETYGTFSTAYVEAMRLRLSALEAENKGLAARVAELEAEKNGAAVALVSACNTVDRFSARVAELEERCKRLEEAAREVYLDSIASDHPWTELETRNMHALRDVLEAKP